MMAGTAGALTVQRLWILLIVVVVACKPAQERGAKPASAAAGPTVRATVVTVRTILAPEGRTITQTIVIAGDRARDTSERDTWRLYDVKAQTVTFVDDLDKTAATESLATLTQRRKAALSTTVAPFHPRPKIAQSGTQTLQGVATQRWTITSGTYKRELWIGEHPSIPSGLFALMQASERVSSPLAPIMREVDAALLGIRGFPLKDRSEIPTATRPIIVERDIVSVTQRDVPEGWVTVPRSYRGASNGGR
jgi:hypothetical protein